MIIYRKRLWFKTAFIFLEDNKVSQIINDGSLSAITILSYNKLSLIKFFEVVKNTACIGLRDTDHAFSLFTDTTRNEVRRSYKLGSLTVKIEDSDYHKLYELYASFERAQGRVPIEMEEFALFTYFGAYIDGELVSVISVIESGKYLRIRSIFSKRLLIGSDKELYKMIGIASKRLMYEVCLWGHEKGYETLDLASVNLHDESKQGITNFKKSFGGRNLNEYTYIYKSFWFMFFEKFVGLRIFFKTLFNLFNSKNKL